MASLAPSPVSQTSVTTHRRKWLLEQGSQQRKWPPKLPRIFIPKVVDICDFAADQNLTRSICFSGGGIARRHAISASGSCRDQPHPIGSTRSITYSSVSGGGYISPIPLPRGSPARDIGEVKSSCSRFLDHPLGAASGRSRYALAATLFQLPHSRAEVCSRPTTWVAFAIWARNTFLSKLF